jgi:hypothetical protein
MVVNHRRTGVHDRPTHHAGQEKAIGNGHLAG